MKNALFNQLVTKKKENYVEILNKKINEKNHFKKN
jgi:hypothetical protein